MPVWYHSTRQLVTREVRLAKNLERNYPSVARGPSGIYTAYMNGCQSTCAFCIIPDDQILLNNDLAYAIWDSSPVVPMHTLVIPRRHAPDFFDLEESELLACSDLVKMVKDHLLMLDPTIEGFNLGVNVGTTAGQTVFHCHIHVIPRRPGDVPYPVGGVRNLIPGKGRYPESQR